MKRPPESKAPKPAIKKPNPARRHALKAMHHLLIACHDEADQKSLYERLKKEGRECRVLTF